MTEVEEKSWELSLYESLRTTQDAITDSKAEIAVSPKSMQSELTCPICLDMLTQTMTTKECLHRFCAECIITALRSGNKECPTCRKKLVSKRSLRHDPNFDQLVARIFPDREEYEEEQQKALAIASKKHSQLLMSGISSAAKAQADHVKMINRKKNLSDYDELVASHAAVGETPDQEDDPIEGEALRKKKKKAGDAMADTLSPNETEAILRPHPDVPQELVERLGETNVRYIKTTLECSVDHIIKYLDLRIKADLETNADDSFSSEPNQPDNFKLYLIKDGEDIELTGPETLEMIKEEYLKKLTRPVEIYYFCDYLPAQEP